MRAGATVIDNSSAFRMDAAVPLVVPEINPQTVRAHHGIIANPNCCAIIAITPLWPIHCTNRIRRLTLATYQAASGAGAAAMEELREGVRLAPDSFIAQLKMGELWMRLRVCEKAKEHTHQAALLAKNLAQSELARRQAATIRTMMREGVERGGYSYKSPWQLVVSFRKLWKGDRPDVEALATVETP